MCNNEIETGNNGVKIGNNGLIEPECWARTVASGNRFSTVACMIIQYCGTRCFVAGYLLQSAALQQAYKSESTRVCLARAIGPYLAPDAKHNPPHAHGLSQAASQSSGLRGLSGGVWALARTPPPPPSPAPDCPGASSSSWNWEGHTRSKESSVEPALRPHCARQVKLPRRHRRPMPLHRPS